MLQWTGTAGGLRGRRGEAEDEAGRGGARRGEAGKEQQGTRGQTSGNRLQANLVDKGERDGPTFQSGTSSLLAACSTRVVWSSDMAKAAYSIRQEITLTKTMLQGVGHLKLSTEPELEYGTVQYFHCTVQYCIERDRSGDNLIRLARSAKQDSYSSCTPLPVLAVDLSPMPLASVILLLVNLLCRSDPDGRSGRFRSC